MAKMSVTEARDDLSETVRRVEVRRERVVLTRHGRDVAALVSAEDLELLELLEDRADLEAIREALAESSERVPYAQLRAELGLP
jgi:prevent-host-death family protein